MKDNNKIDITDFSSNDLDKTSTFTDLVSRTERKQRELEKLEETKKIELKKLQEKLREDEKNIKKKKNSKVVPVKETKLPIEKKKKDILKIVANVFYIISFLSILCLIGYDIYNIKNNVYQMQTIILDSLYLLGIIILGFVINGNKHIKKMFSIFLSIITTSVVTLTLLINFNIISLPILNTVPNFSNKNIGDVLKWSSDNKIKLNQLYENSDTTSEYNVISQSIAPNTITKNIKEFDVVISSGPNYDKTVVLTNLVNYNIDDALKIIKNLKLNNVVINYEINDQVKKDTIINQSKKGELKRSDEVIITVSLGSEAELVPIKMSDLTNKSLFDATLWLKRNGIKYELKYEFSNNIKRNNVISHDIKKDTMIDPKTENVKLVVSKGKEIVLPNFPSMSIDEATTWIITNKLKVNYIEKYDNEFKVGEIILFNYKQGDKVEENTTIILTISKGKLQMESFENIVDFRAWANNLNLNFIEEDVYNDLENGKIIETTPKKGESINIDTPIKVIYSKGKSTTVPNLNNKTKSEITTLCNNSSLKCVFTYGYHDSVANDRSYKQSMSANSTVPVNTTITVYLSKGKYPVAPSCDKSRTITINIQSSLNRSSVNETAAAYRSAYPNINFKFTPRASSIGSTGMVHPDSTKNRTFIANYCDTYEIFIIQN